MDPPIAMRCFEIEIAKSENNNTETSKSNCVCVLAEPSRLLEMAAVGLRIFYSALLFRARTAIRRFYVYGTTPFRFLSSEGASISGRNGFGSLSALSFFPFGVHIFRWGFAQPNYATKNSTLISILFSPSFVRDINPHRWKLLPNKCIYLYNIRKGSRLSIHRECDGLFRI